MGTYPGKGLVDIKAEDNAAPQWIFDRTKGVREGIQQLAAGLFGDCSDCKLISH